MSKSKLPFWIAVIININIVIGSAFFLGAQSINTKSGLLAPFAWLFCGLALLPLVAIFAQYTKKYPTAGGLYVYSEKTLGTFWGFLSGWGYFIGTLAGNGAVVHAFSSYLQQVNFIHPILERYGLLGLTFDIMLVLLFTLLNLCNVQFLGRVQIFFSITKTIPLIILIVGLIFIGDVGNVVNASAHWDGFFGAMPMVFFAFIGIEACCAIADKIENGKQNAYKVIWTSFVIIMLIYVLLQGAILCIQGQTDANPFMYVLPKLFNNQFIVTWGNKIIYSSLIVSFLGGFYGMYYYNNWNIYAIARDGNIIGAQFLSKLNKNHIPWVSVLTQASLLIMFLVLTSANRYLVTISDFGVTIAYVMTAISFLVMTRGIIGLLALLGSSSLLYICFSDLFYSGVLNIIPFVIVIVFGIVAYKLRNSF